METIKKYSIAAAAASIFLACSFNIEWFREAAARAGRHTPGVLKFAALAAAAATYFSIGRRKRDAEKASPAWPKEALAISAAVILFIMPLFQAWTSDEDPVLYRGNSIMGAYFQSNDAGGYYFGAQNLARTGNINDWNSRRPLNVTWQAFMQTLAGWDARWFLIMQATLLGLACYGLARIIGREFGTAAGIATFMLMLMWGRCFVYTTLNESLGMILGASSLALIWTGVRTRNLWWYFSGLAVLTMALNARAGAFFALPVLALWGGWAFSERGRFSVKPVGAGVAAVALGFLIHMLPPLIYNGELSVGHSYSASTVYGISAGGAGWKEVYMKYSPAEMDRAEFEKFIYRKSLEKIKSNPGLAARGLMKYMVRSCRLISSTLIAFFFEKPSTILNSKKEPARIFIFLSAIIILGAGWLRFALLNAGDRCAHLVFFGTAGIIVSLPFLADGGWRAITSTAPFVAVHAGFAFAGLQKRETITGGAGSAGVPPAKREVFSSSFCGQDARAPARHAILPAIISIVILFSCIAGPGIAHQVEKMKHIDSTNFSLGNCRRGEKEIVIDSGKALFLEILAADSAESTFKPRVSSKDLIDTTRVFERQPELLDDKEVVENYSGPKTIIAALDYNAAIWGNIYCAGFTEAGHSQPPRICPPFFAPAISNYFIFAPPGAMENHPDWMYFCGDFKKGDATALFTGMWSIFVASSYGPAAR